MNFNHWYIVTNIQVFADLSDTFWCKPFIACFDIPYSQNFTGLIIAQDDIGPNTIHEPVTDEVAETKALFDSIFTDSGNIHFPQHICGTAVNECPI